MRWILGIALALVLLAGSAVVAGLGKVGQATQPIAFNHRLHLESVGMECTDCHRYAVTGLRATIPNVEVCGDCHAEALTDSAEEQRVVDHVTGDEPIPWQRVYWVPDHVFFSHRRHTAAAGIECATCHGAVGEREQPLARPLVALEMKDCTGCHEKESVSNDCVDCHR